LFCLATENRTQDTGHVSISGPQPICAKSRALSHRNGNFLPSPSNTSCCMLLIQQKRRGGETSLDISPPRLYRMSCTTPMTAASTSSRDIMHGTKVRQRAA
ncbi:MAG: hypothetical protein E6145_09955, partial [Bifidobacterium longum]|nr:hypothetical protein [Bifidobacterium longum]